MGQHLDRIQNLQELLHKFRCARNGRRRKDGNVFHAKLVRLFYELGGPMKGIASGLISPPMHPPRPALFREAGRAGRSGAAMHHAPPCRRIPPVGDTGAVAVPRIRRLWAARMPGGMSRHAGEDVPAAHGAGRAGGGGGSCGGSCGDGPSARSSQWIVRGAEARLRLRPGRRMSPGCPQRRLPPGWAAAPRRRRCPRTGPWPSPGSPCSW